MVGRKPASRLPPPSLRAGLDTGCILRPAVANRLSRQTSMSIHAAAAPTICPKSVESARENAMVKS